MTTGTKPGTPRVDAALAHGGSEYWDVVTRLERLIPVARELEQALALRGEPVAGQLRYVGESIFPDAPLYAAPIGERVREELPCKCGLKTVPQGVDGVLWYWQRHARDECTLELPNEKCWCGLLRSEHITGHADALPLTAIKGEQE